jgi:predicted GNAT family N-acyltransferase
VRVFCDEQGVAWEGEHDELDDEATHLVAVDEDGSVIATCRLILSGAECRLGRMAVAAERRGSGVGRELLTAAEAEAEGQGAREVVLHAQTRAEPFYARAGYAPEGDRFFEEGIEHIAMRKRLAGAAK